MNDETLFDDLIALEDSSFPKKCGNCGKVYHSVKDFIRETRSIDGRSGLKASEGDEGETILELFRNCECGSTLLDFFSERREQSPKGEKRRVTFAKILTKLVKKGIPEEVAKKEILSFLRYRESKLFEELGLFDKLSETTKKAGKTPEWELTEADKPID